MLERKGFFIDYDLDSAAFKYGRLKGYPGLFQGYGAVSAAASTTVTGLAGNNSFAPLRVGDYVIFQTNETTTVRRRVTAKASNDSITVSGGALTFAGIPWFFLLFDIGVGAEDGWHSIEQYERAWVEFDFTLADSLDVQIQVRGRSPAVGAATVFTATYAGAAVNPDPVEITDLIGSVRVGLKATAGFAGADVITVLLSARTRA